MPSSRFASPIQIALILALAQFAANADKAVVSVFAPDLRAAFALSDTQIGSLQGGPFVIGYLLAVLWAGTRAALPASGRYVAGCVLLWTLGAAVFATAGGYEMLLFGRLILACGQAAFIPVAVAILTGQAGDNGPAQGLSAFTASSAVGRSGGLLLGGLLLAGATAVETTAIGLPALAPWRIAALAMLVPNLVLATVLLASPVVTERKPVTRDTPAGLRPALERLFGSLRPLAWLVAGAGVIVVVQSCATWGPSILHRAHGLTTAQAAGLIGGVTLVAAPLGHLAAGRAMTQGQPAAGHPALLLAGAMLMAVAAALVLATSPGLVLTIVALGALIATSGFGAALVLIAYQPLFEPRLRRAANSLFFASVTVVGSALGPAVTGLISDRSAPDGSHLAQALALVTVVAGSLVLLMALILARREPSQPPDLTGTALPPS
ncbi:hypothetical protein BH10PSE2_BH10PSE2_17900 [soil metagenome]